MSIKVKLALLLSAIVSVILLTSFISVYVLYANARQEEFYSRLRDKCNTTYKLLIDVEEIDDKLLKGLDKHSLNALQNEKVLIFDRNNKIIYSNISDRKITYSVSMLDKIRLNGEVRATENGAEVYGVLIRETAQHTYVVLASAYDTYGRQKLEILKWIIIFISIISLVFTASISFFYATRLIAPLQLLDTQVQRVSESNLSEKVTVSHARDEINSLARNFNHMLDRIENAFAVQKSFVQHASHELRTPIASMIAQTEAALARQMTLDEYRVLLASLLEDQEELADLTNSLLLLSKYEQIEFKKDWPLVRLDEIMYKSIDTVQAIFSDYTIRFDFGEIPDSENVLSMPGHEILLQSAFNNLVRNACQYSDDKKIRIQMTASDEGIIIDVVNNGNTLAADEVSQLFTPFFRGQNSQAKKGFGLGLSICARIIAIHNGEIHYSVPRRMVNKMAIHFKRKL